MQLTFGERRISKGTDSASATGSGSADFGQTDAVAKVRQGTIPKQTAVNLTPIGTE